ncbi:nucleotidyl transferase AbiEii/AbiGii toxin family protein [Allokutzneria oryzae]|uniref:Nucleotidyl transferase AbiEii/AbiGii toxin family protein n=1 Tax=Allokutzneria oryzae TaxID=1378989 RepID=A0ABV6A0Y3_9PSEU
MLRPAALRWSLWSAQAELAGRKLIALFDRAAARDFADVYVLAARFGTSLLVERAAEVDHGFDAQVLAEMFRTLSRYQDADIPVPSDEVKALRAFFVSWGEELASAREAPDA